MNERKLTDEEIKKALECCTLPKACYECHYFERGKFCADYVLKDAIDLINRQNAEIERLSEENKVLSRYEDYIKAEAIKEFAERLKEIYRTHEGLECVIDNLVKEMVGDAE